MRNFLLLIFFVLLTACGGGGSKSEHVDPQPVNKNKAPQVSISGNTETPSLTAIRLNTSISDPENEKVTVKWSSSLSDVTFKDQSDAGVLVQFPAVTTDQEVTLTLEVTDSANNKVKQTFTVMVKATNNQVDIDLQDKYEFYSGDSVKITAKFSSSEEITDVEWQTDELELANKQVTTQESNNSGSSIVTFTAPTLASKYSYTLNFVVTTDHDQYRKPFELTIMPKSEAGLTVNIDASYDVNEQDYLLIEPEIQSSERITSYQWRWLDTSLGELINAKNETVTIKANEVSDDKSAILVLDVESQSGEKKSVQTEVKVKNVVQIGKLSLEINRAYAAPGQEVQVSVDTDSADDIQSFEWVVSSDSITEKTETATSLTMIIPEQNSLVENTLVTYKVTFKDGREFSKNATFGMLSKSSVSSVLRVIEPETKPQLYKGEELIFTAQLQDKAGILDSISLDVSDVKYVDLDVAELTQLEDAIQIKLKASDIQFSATMMLRIVMQAGTVSTTDYVDVRLNKSHLKLFTGSRKTYILGSDFYVFGYAQDYYGQDNHDLTWSTASSELEVKMIASTVAKVTNSSISTYPKVVLNAVDKDGENITEDGINNMTSAINQTGEKYNCYFRVDEVRCRDSNNLLFDVGEITVPVKQGISRGNYFCLLNNQGEVSCFGSLNEKVTKVPVMDVVSDIVAVSKEDACAKLISGAWHCWGEKESYFNDLLKDKANVDTVVSTDKSVCLVNNGYIECYDLNNNLIYKNQNAFIETIEMSKTFKKLCYRTTEQSLNTCPSEIE